MYNKNINIKVDYRIIREDGMDQDIIIPIENGLIDLNVSVKYPTNIAFPTVLSAKVMKKSAATSAYSAHLFL